jgi:hypothetical protein
MQLHYNVRFFLFRSETRYPDRNPQPRIPQDDGLLARSGSPQQGHMGLARKDGTQIQVDLAPT